MYICIYIYMCVYMYVYKYIYVCARLFTFIHLFIVNLRKQQICIGDERYKTRWCKIKLSENMSE